LLLLLLMPLEDLLLLPFKGDGLALSWWHAVLLAASVLLLGNNNLSSSFANSLDANAEGNAGVGVETISSLSSPSLHNEEDAASLSISILRL
jgi:hypothetical protein